MKNQLHSIVVPVYNSRAFLETLANRVSQAMAAAGIHFELILVDDGSRDGSFQEIKRLSDRHAFIRGFKLSRNFGHQAALMIGLEQSLGEYVAIIDDDLQDPPELLPEFFEKLTSEADVVYGVRQDRKENIVKKMFFLLYYRILRMFSNVKMPLDAGDFCAMRRKVVEAILNFHDVDPFVRGIRAWVGFRQVGILYKRHARQQGKSGYSLRKYFGLALTGILSFSYLPLRLATILGMFAAFAGFLYAIYIVVHLLVKPFDVPGYTSLIVIITFLGGIQLIAIGILGEYLGRLSDNIRKKEVAVISEKTEEEVL
jgi:polyisoprenyl-phosphate glycosyltransferase